jgi:uncharacterized protein YdeI (YjbR/CyaY-like superfamily)
MEKCDVSRTNRRAAASTAPSRGEAAVLAFSDAQEFEGWLDQHGDLQTGVWIKIAKISSGLTSLTSDEAVDVGLCFGWISGQRKPLDDLYYLQKYVPRRRGSHWSRVNVDKVAMLNAANRMRPRGQAEVDAAKADGRWEAAYASQRNAGIPVELAALLRENLRAAQAFQALGKTRRYALILPLLTARDQRTKTVRLAKLIAALEEG